MKEFYKYNCAGNDFVLIPQRAPAKKPQESAKKLCALHTGIGADGIIYVWKTRPKTWQWRFFNSDGSETSLCGNATRAVADFLFSQTDFKKSKEVTWKGSLGTFCARRATKSYIDVTWPVTNRQVIDPPEQLLEELTGFNDRGLCDIAWVNVGVPHLVLVNHETWSPQDRMANNPTLRSHPALGREGANVTWYSKKDKTAVTFERGVERETLACGSGALALYLTLTKNLANSQSKWPIITLNFPGAPLKVRLHKDELWLSGPVKLVFKGILHEV